MRELVRNHIYLTRYGSDSPSTGLPADVHREHALVLHMGYSIFPPATFWPLILGQADPSIIALRR